MEFFRKAKTVRLISHKDKYLVADDDLVTISQDSTESTTASAAIAPADKKLSAKNAIWTVELVPGKDSVIRLQSCFGTYLTASSQPCLPGVTGKRIVQTMPGPDGDVDNVATEWEPQRDGMQVRLRSFCGHFLRPHGGLPPWRNSITHDIPHRPNTWNKILWDVNVVEKRRHTMESGSAKSTNYLGRSRSRSFSGSMSFKILNFQVSQERI